MLLVIDVGNTNITLGLYDGDQLGPRWRLATSHGRMPDEYGLQFLGLLAHDGVSCTLCHQIQPANLGQPSSFTGRFDIAPTREIFGPYDDVFAGPIQVARDTQRIARHRR